MNTKKENIGNGGEIILTGDQYAGSRAKEELERKERANREKQDIVDAYNKEILEGAKADIERFKNYKFMNNSIIVKLLQHDWIDKTESDFLGGSAVSKVQKIYIETPQKNKEPQLIDNPLPYRFEGIIVAMDEDIVNKDPHYAQLKPGTLVRTVSFDLKESRYYPDEGKRDWVDFIDLANLNSKLFPNYEGYTKIHPGMIENIYLDSKELMND